MTVPIYAIIIIIVCLIAMFIFAIFLKKNQKFKIVGTMHIDTSREDKDICLFTLDLPLEDIKKERVVLIKIDGASSLHEWDQ